MASDQEIVKQLQQRFQNWNPAGYCPYHWGQPLCCVYDKQGRLIQLHLCRLGLVQVPSEIWQCLSLQKLYLSDNRLSALPAEVCQVSSLQGLHLGENRLSTLPPEVGQLSSLQDFSSVRTG